MYNNFFLTLNELVTGETLYYIDLHSICFPGLAIVCFFYETMYNLLG